MPAAGIKAGNGLLPKRDRITNGDEIRSVVNRKQFIYSSPEIRIIAATNGLRNTRICVICRKNLGDAVVRNRTRRRVLAGICKIRHNIKENINIVFMPKLADTTVIEYVDLISFGLRQMFLC